MKRGFVVIGSGFGDEGKGVMTDFLAERHLADLTVRFNSGAQAGHTVVRGNKRHVFGHFGAATLQGVPTYLSKYFVVNPLKFRQERDALQGMGAYIPPVIVHPDCIVTTPYDVFMNHMNEKYRGAARHGSCGMGFNETIIRHLGAFKHRFNDERCEFKMSDPMCQTSYAYLLQYYKGTGFIKRMHRIRKDWFMDRYRELKNEGVFTSDKLNEEELDILMSDGLVTNYIDDLEFLFDYSTVSKDAIDTHETIVFEGAQGLQLSQDSANFPHVTRSYTGRRNLKALLSESEPYESLETIYATRCYQTKHGAGPFEDTDISECIAVNDPTNQPNEFQGTIRTAYLNPPKLFTAIRQDIDRNPLPNCKASIAVTCLEQIKGSHIKIDRSIDGSVERTGLYADQFSRRMRVLSNWMGIEGYYTAKGPSAKTVERLG